MKTSDFDYNLPEEMIAQVPIEPRDSSRLMVYDRKSRNILHGNFHELPDFLCRGDLLVLNDTRVFPARLIGEKSATGGRCEILLLREINSFDWVVIVGGSGIKEGVVIDFSSGIGASVVQVLDGPQRILRFSKPIAEILDVIGNIPLPPYIKEYSGPLDRYQTVFANSLGSSAAPTAGLHFTPELMDMLKEKGIDFVYITLHIGLDTFLPVTEASPHTHQIHTEWCLLSEEAVRKINETHRKGHRIIAVGTTCVRTLETAWKNRISSDIVGTYEGFTDLFILPGYNFRVVDALVTNFHLPKSTLLMLVSAFAGRDEILSLYQVAIENQYRFYSFGDAMLIL